MSKKWLPLPQAYEKIQLIESYTRQLQEMAMQNTEEPLIAPILRQAIATLQVLRKADDQAYRHYAQVYRTMAQDIHYPHSLRAAIEDEFETLWADYGD